MSVVWVVGSGGLLGRAVRLRIEESTPTWAPTEPISWIDEETYHSTIESAVKEFENVVRKDDGCWRIFWCAGLGTIGATHPEIDGELSRLSYLVSTLRDCLGNLTSLGTIFYSSSAGAIYGGSDEHLITEESHIAVNSRYGIVKMQAEVCLEEFARDTKCRVAIGRIATVYGSGQNIRKQQGLITAACLSALRHQPFEIFVPLDTIRNYVFVADAADIIVSFTDKVSGLSASSVERKIICSPCNLSIAALLSDLRLVIGRRPAVTLGWRPASDLYNRNLSMASVRHRDTEPAQFTSMVRGIACVRQSLLIGFMSGSWN